ncbi:adhesion G protein-coupled receptor F5 isoform X1 [Podarcis lilfordi]|uniref:Adhesion G protein-coupled receptor F5 isoform X1 n=2 Tax=Podarcis lilfordi TaxID=74358 RepID=A0AA35K1E3_9SAUR|nr:adhesion G protein-coupled receptor F5 isoform X1 [Podarcis lilfordi]
MCLVDFRGKTRQHTEPRDAQRQERPAARKKKNRDPLAGTSVKAALAFFSVLHTHLTFWISESVVCKVLQQQNMEKLLPWKITMFCTLIVVSTASQNFNFGSFIHSPIYSKSNGGEEQRELHRQKRQDVTLGISPVEYTVAVEISLPDSSLLEALRSYLNSLSFPVSVNASDSAVNISSIDVTTVCTSGGPQGTHCSCESGYEWPASACRAAPACPSAAPAGESCPCLVQRPPRGTYCQPQSAGVPFIYIIKMSVRLDKDFEDDLRNLSSSMFKRYKSDLEKAFTKGYKSLPGFRSVKVAGFRPGSIMVQYELTSAVNMPPESANTDAAEALDRSYKIVPTSFEVSSMEVHGGTNISISPDDIFEGDTVTMTCESNSSLGATWHFPETFSRGRELPKNDTIDGKSTSTLKITNIKLEDAGYYRCSFMEWINNVSVIHVAGTNITVSPIKIVPSEDVVIVCNGDTKELSCCTDRDMQFFTYYWKINGAINISGTTTATHNCTKYLLQANESQCPADKSATKTDYTCELNTTNGARKHKVISVTYFRVAKKVACNSSEIGTGEDGAELTRPCRNEANHPVRGSITYKCKHNLWEIVGNSCLAVPVDNLLSAAESLVSSPEQKKNLPEFLSHLNRTIKQQQQSMKAVANLKAVVEILNMVSVVPVAAERETMENFLSTVDTVISSPAKTWKDFVNGTSQLLASVEQFSGSLQPINNSIPSISYDNLQLKGVVIDKSKVSDYDESFTFSKPSNLSGSVLINEAKIETGISTIISVAYSSLGPIIPQYKKMDEFIVNGLVMTTLINANSSLSEEFRIIMTFMKDNKTLKNPRCVFWNFSFSEDGGGWDVTGCETTENGDNVTCSCNHLTSFSILMSPGHDPWDTLDYMSYIGVSISILSLVACIGIEFVVWKSVTKARISYMRHVCILNIAISLLIADVWFIVVAAMHDTNTKMDQAWLCIAAAFFVQFFYLCVFFWMLTLGLMVFYHIVFIVHNASKTIMKALSFCLGYFCPLAISAITVSSTHPHYTRKKVCLLNWDESRALLALVIPAMIIVAVNVIVTIVVIAKMQRRSIGEKSINKEKSSLYRITKCIGVLTSLLGLTWLFGLATVIPGSPRAFHYLFTLFNAFQGLFILLLGILSDRTVWEALWKKCSLSSWSSQHTKSTSQGMSAPMLSISSPFSKTLNNWFGKTGKYQVSSTEPASSSASESTSKAYSLLN